MSNKAGWGGARPGSGRKPKQQKLQKAAQASIQVDGDVDMLSLLQKVALGQIEASALQVRAAIAAVQYTHAKVGEGGKKDERQEAAKKAGSGRFAASAPPLALVRK